MEIENKESHAPGLGEGWGGWVWVGVGYQRRVSELGGNLLPVQGRLLDRGSTVQSPTVGCPGCFVQEPQSHVVGAAGNKAQSLPGSHSEGATGQRAGTQLGFSLRAIGSHEGQGGG